MEKGGVHVDKAFLAEEVGKVKGVYIPVKASLITRLLVKKTKCRNLHPNPEDEFSMPEIGPNYQIISKYEDQYRHALKAGAYKYLEEPVIVEKLQPDGYLILNGHHRWAAALQLGYSRIPIRVVNPSHEEDIVSIIQNSKHNRRATLDLDEVVFRGPEDADAEKALPLPLNRIYKQRLRLGIPALFRYLSMNGYDIWVYTAQYYSMDYIKRLFMRYHVHVDGIITGIKSKSYDHSESARRVKELIENKYPCTIHIDRNSVLRVSGVSGEFDERSLECSPGEWSQAVMTAVKELGADEK